MAHLLIESMAKYINLLPEEERCLLASFTVEEHKAKTFLLREGEISKRHIFVLSGILRLYTVDDNLVEHTMGFSPRGWWMGDMYSFLSGKPGNSFIEVVEEAKIMCQTRKKQLVMFDEIPKLERFHRILVERSLVAHQQRLLDIMRLSAEERYLKFCERFPDIKYRLPQKQIASYLGITPEFFSKMKANMLRRK